MKVVLLSGGSGKRLWPLSNDSRSKQFLRVLQNDDMQMVSMVQRVWHQLELNGLGADSYIATGKSQIEMMQTQVGTDIPLIVEPERRDTFPAIALAATYLYSVQSVGLNEVVAILPVDPYVEDHFFEVVKQLEEAINSSGAYIGLIGVKPTYPSSKYGYIIPETANQPLSGLNMMQVLSFQEKPTEDEADLLINNGALWNCGVFAFKLDYIINHLQKNGLPIQYDELLKQYGNLPKISFDYEILEKEREIIVVPYEGYWKDLGTWNTLTEEMGSGQIGKGIISEDCTNTHLINELDIPVVVLGVSDLVVATSPDGILVTDKSASPRIKDTITFNNVPKYEERHWGWCKTLDIQQYEDGNQVVTKRLHVLTGKNLSYCLNRSCQEVWTIVKGSAEFIHNGNRMSIKAGNVMHIPAMTMHGLKAITDVEFIAVQSGPVIMENDSVELYTDWEEIEQHCVKI
ncbi:sugar phosphate nucleotidyltransferase [Paenibacillus sp. 7516]|uniref:sugar phosphate nucleotidyltransferase n=1 Tax=Paenibacillus sp. 7516 TaxID=2022549 RepID=UPI000BA74784|nr:sugar phosphate nucleotidyltransferase [Paenibacillus sp. 7516]PAF31567.1 mannose-1-phosphate guanylyltransferase [Paenibacillus sp. 7516]